MALQRKDKIGQVVLRKLDSQQIINQIYRKCYDMETLTIGYFSKGIINLFYLLNLDIFFIILCRAHFFKEDQYSLQMAPTIEPS